MPMILCMKMLSIHCHESTYLETFPHLFVEMIDNHMLSHGLKNCSYNFKTLLTRQAALNCCNMNAYYWCKVSLICEMSICQSLNIRYLLQLGSLILMKRDFSTTSMRRVMPLSKVATFSSHDKTTRYLHIMSKLVLDMCRYSQFY